MIEKPSDAASGSHRHGSFAGRTVAITGGVGGIGLATAGAFLDSGAEVILIDVDDTRLAAAASQLQSKQVVTHRSRLESAKQCAKALAAGQRPAHALIHLAGIIERDFFKSEDRSIWDRTIAANLTTAYDMSVAFLRQVERGGSSARIVLTSSMVYRRGAIGGAAYGASKGGIAGLARSLARHLAPDILVNAIAPGVIVTPMTEDMRATRHEELIRDIPLQRYGKPEEVASVIHFLCGPGSTFITGQVINIDGGQISS
jgi:NAD(P)-dependent dehydrogenase (short-subunit alcohol dehydrogenase family)